MKTQKLLSLYDIPKPVNGAATYTAGRDPETGKYYVYMIDDTGTHSDCDSAKTMDGAIKKAISWQKRENAAVLKEQKRIAKSNQQQEI